MESSTPVDRPVTTHGVARDNPFKPVWGLFAILVGLTLIMVARSVFAAKEIVPWRTDVEAAMAEGKPQLLYFTASWCGPCQTMKRTTWTDARVEAALRGYVPIKVDHDARPDLVLKYQVEAVPTMFVLDESGKVTKAQVGAIEAGEFVRWLKGAGWEGDAVR